MTRIIKSLKENPFQDKEVKVLDENGIEILSFVGLSPMQALISGFIIRHESFDTENDPEKRKLCEENIQIGRWHLWLNGMVVRRDTEISELDLLKAAGYYHEVDDDGTVTGGGYY